jgi:catechol 2,3-dioxygenase-like lactoylglutathione lyase family enzyme
VTAASPPHLRLARPSRDLGAAKRFYTQALDFQVLAEFADHDGFDGVMLGYPGWTWHLELTRRRSVPVDPRPTDEDLLVLYLPDRAAWHDAVRRCRAYGASPVASSNPWWDERGITFEDTDGYRIVLEQGEWA